MWLAPGIRILLWLLSELLGDDELAQGHIAGHDCRTHIPACKHAWRQGMRGAESLPRSSLKSHHPSRVERQRESSLAHVVPHCLLPPLMFQSSFCTSFHCMGVSQELENEVKHELRARSSDLRVLWE